MFARSLVSSWLADERRPGATSCIGLSIAFDMPFAEVIRNVGYPLPPSETVEREDELVDVFREMDASTREYFVAIGKAMVTTNRQRNNGNGKI